MHPTIVPDATRVLMLEGPLSIYNVADTKPLLSTALQGAISLRIDLSAVDELDCAGLQLLFATRKQAHKADIDLYFSNPSPVITELLTLSGLQELLPEQEPQ